MTIASSTNKHLYSGTGAQTVFPYTYKIFEDADLVVIHRAADGTETALTLDSHYTVSGAGDDAGGSVTLIGAWATTPPASGTKLLVKRVLDLTQETDWVDNDPFPAATIEGAIDRVVCIAQQLQEQLDRAATVSETSTSTGIDPEQIAIDAAKAEAAAAAAATFDPALYIAKSVVSNAGDIIYGTASGAVDNLPKSTDGKVLTLVSGLPSWQQSSGKWTALASTTDFSTTAASTSTITMNTDQTATIKAGMAIKFTLSGTVYYAIVSAITSNLLTIAGAPLTTTASALTALSYGMLPPIVERIAIPGYWADAADTALIANDLSVSYVWRGPKAYLVQIGARVRVEDTGVEPRLNARIGSTTTDYVSTSNSNAGIEPSTSGVWTGVDISTAKYAVSFGDVVELKTDANGGTDDSQDLTATLVFVVE